MTNVCETHSWAQKEPWAARGVEKRQGENEEERFWVELFSSKNKRWLFPSKQVLETFCGLTPNIKTFFWQEGTWLCSNMFTKLLQNTLEGRDPLCPQRLREVRPEAPPAAPTELRAAPQRAEIPLPALPGRPAAQGGHFHVLWSLQMASQWESPLYQGRWSSRHL